MTTTTGDIFRAQLAVEQFVNPTQWQIDEGRFGRLEQLFTCASAGDVGAGQILLGYSQSVGNSPLGMSYAQALWAQLSSQLPQLTNTALQGGAVADGGSACGVATPVWPWVLGAIGLYLLLK